MTNLANNPSGAGLTSPSLPLSSPPFPLGCPPRAYLIWEPYNGVHCPYKFNTSPQWPNGRPIPTWQSKTKQTDQFLNYTGKYNRDSSTTEIFFSHFLLFFFPSCIAYMWEVGHTPTRIQGNCFLGSTLAGFVLLQERFVRSFLQKQL